MASPSEMEHPDDGLLAAAAHRQPLPAINGILRHIDGCDQCRRRVDEVRRDEPGIATLLAALDHPMPPRPAFAAIAPAPGRRRGVRRGVLAASLTLLATVGVAAALPSTALHRWLREQLVPRPTQEPAPKAGATSSAGLVAGISVAATPSLIVAFRHGDGGVVEIVPTAGAGVAIRSSGGLVGYQVGDGRIVVDDRRPAARYEIQLPSAVQHVTVMAGDRVVFENDRGRVTPERSMIAPGRYRVLLHQGTP